ncbi:hypothetical protein GCM10010924_17100 [Rhizobium wenxiniae]|nr:hypothetical protein GCM10010924_17100 [Rhizobium wenxiniae]
MIGALRIRQQRWRIVFGNAHMMLRYIGAIPTNAGTGIAWKQMDGAVPHFEERRNCFKKAYCVTGAEAPSTTGASGILVKLLIRLA